MFKKILVGIAALVLIVTVSACSAGTHKSQEKEEFSNPVVGIWSHEGPNDDRSDFGVYLDLQDNGDYEMIVSDQGTPMGAPGQTDAEIKGTYQITDGNLEMQISSVTDPSGLLSTGVTPNSQVILSYQLGDEDDYLTFKDFGSVVPSMNENTEFFRVN